MTRVDAERLHPGAKAPPRCLSDPMKIRPPCLKVGDLTSCLTAGVMVSSLPQGSAHVTRLRLSLAVDRHLDSPGIVRMFKFHFLIFDAAGKTNKEESTVVNH